MAVAAGAEGLRLVAELKEFAGFEKGTQRYIRRALDLGLGRRDAARRWARDPGEMARIRAQADAYRRLDALRTLVAYADDQEAAEALLAPLIAMTGFDLGEGRLPSFAAYRFLYERLLGARVRPWLPAAFCAAAALPHLHPERRRSLLASVTESVATAAGWSVVEPLFLPEWVEKVDTTVPA